jgi:hypothetical protein
MMVLRHVQWNKNRDIGRPVEGRECQVVGGTEIAAGVSGSLASAWKRGSEVHR